MTGQAAVIDGKYQVVRELAREGHVTLSEVRAGEGVTRRVAWFNVNSPASRQGFYAYRAALRAIAPAGLTDVVARPGAYYAVWQPVTGLPLAEVAAQPIQQEETIQAVHALAARLAEHGYALPDADVVVDGHDVRVAYLRPAPEGRTPEEVARLNAAALAPFTRGRVKRRRQPGAWLTFVPGLLFLGGAVYLGMQALQIYLNPPVHEVLAVTGQPAPQAAQRLTAAGFQVEYAKGEAAGVPIGAVIRQDPAAGTSLPVGRLVTLTVNSPPSLSVPKLEELTLDQARAALRDSALTLGKVLRVDGSLTKTPEGRVIAQMPEAGADLQRGQPVQLLVSSGVRGRETWLANLTGMSYQAARKNAQVAGLVVTRVIQQPSDAPENTVLDQTPAPYVRVPVGSPVTLTVAVARYAPPSQPAGSLPLPPPSTPSLPSGSDPNSSLLGGTGQNATGQEGTGELLPEQPATVPAAPESVPGQTSDTSGAGVSATVPAARSVHFRYAFPADLPAGTYTISVQDADGEREIQGATDSTQLAGAVAEGDPVVRGDATFIIRRNGEEYATVKP
ncbi:PASTA domains protein [Deinococcus geothermalis DSM 11300]|uniref:PASTA domains protein n=1 Tax=Deinococcus geothermalis (strain DSM 11300 / CIP 105573 / AG-3a) TaxID=319795 RepID=Q1IWY7_DEIGD|nr:MULTISPECIES: PASTA domain-containing protein [Deinococcus]ABF46247.1 PASTA domains protein [Deinococcus geothermalis DSM 11300]MBI0444710.1 PASTA domain-containing protein [Deinococcus sp. DB0503]